MKLVSDLLSSIIFTNHDLGNSKFGRIGVDSHSSGADLLESDDLPGMAYMLFQAENMPSKLMSLWKEVEIYKFNH